MVVAKKLEEIRALSDEELIRQHDELAVREHTSPDYFLNELHRREQSESALRMERFTRQILWLTIFIAILTFTNVATFAYQILFLER